MEFRRFSFASGIRDLTVNVMFNIRLKSYKVLRLEKTSMEALSSTLNFINIVFLSQFSHVPEKENMLP